MMRGFLNIVRTYASKNRVKPHQKPIVYKPINAQIESIKAKGFLRPIKPYEPPRDFKEIVDKVVADMGGISNFKDQKFDLLRNCSTVFNYSVPNSQLFEMKTLKDVVRFYGTPIDTHTPYETLVKENDLPNLHVIAEYRRYNPETDGISAFPKSSTLVTGLKYRKKYKGHKAKTSWP
ncbi:CLUMA_CG019036, isoform A [Clunio marinus]|uniref:Large ribosomal subunit protein mL50 n=1 Tax=Clunio marinus TaxID=568069 RepID=A0A1J1J4A1_9DIPT|nr:CLUMA_CG019036, isoform A [Clunio marinus]